MTSGQGIQKALPAYAPQHRPLWSALRFSVPLGHRSSRSPDVRGHLPSSLRPNPVHSPSNPISGCCTTHYSMWDTTHTRIGRDTVLQSTGSHADNTSTLISAHQTAPNSQIIAVTFGTCKLCRPLHLPDSRPVVILISDFAPPLTFTTNRHAARGHNRCLYVLSQRSRPSTVRIRAPPSLRDTHFRITHISDENRNGTARDC